MSEQENKFIRLLKKWVIGGITSITSLMIVSMFWFYMSANSRLKALEEDQFRKLNTTEFENYKNYQELKETYTAKSLDEIKAELKDIKNKL